MILNMMSLPLKECTFMVSVLIPSCKFRGCDSRLEDLKSSLKLCLISGGKIAGLYAKMIRETDKERADSVAELIDWLFCQPNPIPVNTALAMCGLVKPVFRLPYVPLSRQEREKGAELLRAVLPHLPGVTEVNVLEDDDFECVSWY